MFPDHANIRPAADKKLYKAMYVINFYTSSTYLIVGFYENNIKQKNQSYKEIWDT